MTLINYSALKPTEQNKPPKNCCIIYTPSHRDTDLFLNLWRNKPSLLAGYGIPDNLECIEHKYQFEHLFPDVDRQLLVKEGYTSVLFIFLLAHLKDGSFDAFVQTNEAYFPGCKHITVDWMKIRNAALGVKKDVDWKQDLCDILDN